MAELEKLLNQLQQFGLTHRYKMSEFFLELFSEEIPAELQKNFREKIFEDFQNLFKKNWLTQKKVFHFLHQIG